MKVSQVIAATSALVATAVASPVSKTYEAPAKANYTDADILNYALTLEHLEDKFYREGLANFTQANFSSAGYDQTFYQNLKEISYDETTHVSFLTAALKKAGATPVAECTYSFGVTSVASFLATAAVLEGVGVTAYLGAAAKIANKDYLTAAGSILTVEARHTAYLRGRTGQRPFAQAFDVPLDFDQVYTLAAPFIVSCPSTNPKFLNLASFPKLSVTSTGPYLTNGTLAIAAVQNAPATVYAAFVSVTGPVFAPVTKSSSGALSVMIPAGIHGQSYLVLTSSNTAVTDDNTIAGPAIVEISGTDGVPTSA